MTATLPIQANYKELNAVALLLAAGATPLYLKQYNQCTLRNSGAGKESRTPDLNLGKVALYQLSYSRNVKRIIRNNFAELNPV